MKVLAPLLLAVALASTTALPAASQEPLVAGSDVKAPRRVTFVQPEFPPKAQARGLRGIVILELVIDEEGRVANAEVVRSVPPFDEPAIEAARQWKYEVTKVDGVPVKVRLSVPITFAMRLPSMERAPGIPELRQGVGPSFPEGSRDGVVSARITLAPDGQVVDALVESGDSPLADALLTAIRTWRFAASPDGATISFRLRASFANGGVELRLSDPHTSAAPAAAMPATAAGDPGVEPPPAAAPAPGPEAEPATEVPAPETPAPGGSASESGDTPAETPSPEVPSADMPATGSPATEAPEPASEVPPEPATEVITSPPRPELPAPTPRSTRPGISAVRDVQLGEGVPDLVAGRHPIVPPFARMARVSGTVLVSFSVDAAGACLVRTVDGPELLEPAAEDTVGSWTFRRTHADRLFLVAELTYQGGQASASVRFQE